MLRGAPPRTSSATSPGCTTAQYDLGYHTAPGISVNNLMSQTACSPTSQQLERSQLQQIFNTPEFR